MSTWPICRFAAIFALFLILGASSASAFAQATPAATPEGSTAVTRAVAWLTSQQQANGSWVGFTGEGDPGVTIDAVLALVAAGNGGVPVGLESATRYLSASARSYAESGTGQAAKVVLVAIALGEDPAVYAGFDPLEMMLDGFNGAADMYGTGLYDTALVGLALGAINKDLPSVVLDSIRNRQTADGSWAFDGTTSAGNGDTNTTAIVIQALVALDHTEGDMILHGIEYLQRSQLANGFPFQPGPGAAADANSTGIVIQALVAAGEDPAAQEWQNVSGSLMAFQNESGSFSYLLDPKDENLFATVQAIPALASQPFPIVSSAESDTAESTRTPDQQPGTPVADLPWAA